MLGGCGGVDADPGEAFEAGARGSSAQSKIQQNIIVAAQGFDVIIRIVVESSPSSFKVCGSPAGIRGVGVKFAGLAVVVV